MAVEEHPYDNERFKSLIENMSDMISVIDADGIIRYLSPSVKMILGYETDGALGRDFLEFLHPEDNARIAEDFARLTRGSATLMRTEGRLQHRGGSWRTLEFIVSRLTGDGERIEFVVNARDITDRKQVELELEEQLLLVPVQFN